MAAPGTGIEEGNDAKGTRGGLAQAAAEDVAGDGFGPIRDVGVEQNIDAIEESNLEPVSRAPVHEEGALVFE